MEYCLVEYLKSGAVVLRDSKVSVIDLGTHTTEEMASEAARSALLSPQCLARGFYKSNNRYWTLYNGVEYKGLIKELNLSEGQYNELRPKQPSVTLKPVYDVLEEFTDEIA